MNEHFCQRCRQFLNEDKFWKIYNNKPIDKIADLTKRLVKGRGNIQRYCKKCCRNWFSDNKWRVKGYTQNYWMKRKARESEQQINIS